MRPVSKCCICWIAAGVHRADLAQHLASNRASPTAPFLSKFALLATRSLNEALMALAVLDLPLAPASPPDVVVADGALCFVASEPLVS